MVSLNQIEQKWKFFIGLTISNFLYIIILLILVGISILALTQTGLFEKAKQAEPKSKEAQEQENALLGNYENELNKYITGKTD